MDRGAGYTGLMIARYTHRDIVWVDIESPTREEVRSIMGEFDIHPIVADELLGPSLRPKVDHYENFLYLILHFPAVRHSHVSGTQEVDFIIGKNFLITVRYELLDPLHKFSKVFEANSILDKSDIGDHAGYLFFYMLKKLYSSIRHELDAMADELSAAESRIFEGAQKAMVGELARINRELLSIFRALRLHENVLESFKLASMEFFDKKYGHYADNLLGEYHKVRQITEDHRELLHSLRETNNSLLSTKTNEIMKTLTAITIITFPASFISWMFAVEAEHKPITGLPFDFWILSGLMVFFSLATYLYMKWKEWL